MITFFVSHPVGVWHKYNQLFLIHVSIALVSDKLIFSNISRLLFDDLGSDLSSISNQVKNLLPSHELLLSNEF